MYICVDTCTKKGPIANCQQWQSPDGSQTPRAFFFSVLFCKSLILNMHYFSNQKKVIKIIFKCRNKKKLLGCTITVVLSLQFRVSIFILQAKPPSILSLPGGVSIFTLNLSFLIFLFASYLQQVKNPIIKLVENLKLRNN